MDPEDIEPRTAKPKPRDLEPLSVAELESYIGDLEAEIGRARAAIAAKRNERAGAEALFRRKGG